MNEKFQQQLQNELNDLEKKDCKRFLRLVTSEQSSHIKLNNKDVLNFCSNNYLGLANDRRLKDAAVKAMNKYGFGTASSRLICGHMSLHQSLENKIAEFKGEEACLLYTSGYMANVGIISALFSKDDIIFSDKLNHASIVDGIQLSRAKCARYKHLDMEHLETLLKKHTSYRKRCIVTDSIFSMDGDVAPLDKIVELAKKYNCIVMVDEAHAFGVMGKSGRGLVEHFQLENQIEIQMGTLSKAAGAFGAYCCGSRVLIDYLIHKSRSFIYTTAMPIPIAAASMQAVEIIEKDKDLRKQLWENTFFMRLELKGLGFDPLYSQSPIIPVVINDPAMAVQFSQELLKKNIFVSAIRPPTVPHGMSRLRMTVMATHTQQDMNYVLDAMKKIGKKLCLI